MTNMTADPAELSAIAPPGVLAGTQTRSACSPLRSAAGSDLGLSRNPFKA